MRAASAGSAAKAPEPRLTGATACNGGQLPAQVPVAYLLSSGGAGRVRGQSPRGRGGRDACAHRGALRVGEGGEHMALERWYSVAELNKLTGWPKRTIYDAIERGELASVIPNGCVRGRRVSESEWRRWCEERQRRA